MRNQTNYNKPVGIDFEGNLIIVNYIFDDEMHGKPFCGATGSTLAPLTQAYVDDRNNVDAMKDLGYDEIWREAVKAGSTEQGLDDFLADILRYNTDGLFPGHDTGDTQYADLQQYKDAIYANMNIGANFPSVPDDVIDFECIGCGRMFPVELAIVFDQELLDAINAIELKAKQTA